MSEHWQIRGGQGRAERGAGTNLVRKFLPFFHAQIFESERFVDSRVVPFTVFVVETFCAVLI